MTKRKLVDLCRFIGSAVPRWTQGMGGNLSVKVKGQTLIKASGFRLDDIKAGRGLVAVDTRYFQRKARKIKAGQRGREKEYDRLLRESASDGEKSARPSIETGMHVVLPKKTVLHFHSLPSLLMGHEWKKNPRRFLRWMKAQWPGSFKIMRMVAPGILLMKEIQKIPAVSLYILENHGVILHSDDGRILKSWIHLENRFCRDWGYGALLSMCPLPPKKADRTLGRRPAPWRLYMPDSALFQKRLSEVLARSRNKGKEPMFRLKLKAMRRDRNVAELWKGTDALYRVCPSLKEISWSFSRLVSNLPAEKFRHVVYAKRY